jgi:hypothetical protein
MRLTASNNFKEELIEVNIDTKIFPKNGILQNLTSIVLQSQVLFS